MIHSPLTSFAKNMVQHESSLLRNDLRTSGRTRWLPENAFAFEWKTSPQKTQLAQDFGDMEPNWLNLSSNILIPFCALHGLVILHKPWAIPVIVMGFVYLPTQASSDDWMHRKDMTCSWSPWWKYWRTLLKRKSRMDLWTFFLWDHAGMHVYIR